MSDSKFCLRWNDFETNISVAFRELREDKDFFDVTLACDDQQVQAHKVILAACSPFFRGVLKKNQHAHPLLYMRNVKHTDLLAVLNFMYHGEVNVAQEDLNSFLAVAEDLKVKGLTQGDQRGSSSAPPSKAPSYSNPLPPPRQSARPPDREPLPPPQKRPRPTFPRDEDQQRDEEVQEVVMPSQVKSEPMSQAINPVVEMGYEEEQYEEYSQEYGQETGQGYEGGVLSGGAEGNKGFDPSTVGNYDDLMLYVVKTSGGYACCCGSFRHQWKMNVQNHVESIHFPGHFKWNCEVCGEEAKTRNILAKHKSKFHPKNPSAASFSLY